MDYENITCSEFIKKRKFATIYKTNYDRFYRIWQNMRQRCINKNNPSYKYYGGRGIGFLLTIEDIIKLWFRDKAWRLKIPSIDREDNDGNYIFSNYRFIEKAENTRRAHKKT